MSNTQPIEEQPEAGQPCATCAGIELIADPDEHWQYRNGEPMAPDAAAFLEYLRGVEQRLVAAEARVAELESQLAAQGWRPVTEKPDKPGWYVVYDSDGHVFYNADIFPYRVARWTGKWDSAFNGLVDYWRPLPPAPQETTP